MIEHRPDWDGFALAPLHMGPRTDSLMEPRTADEKARFDEIRSAWLRQIGPSQRNAMVLHNAAMFFALREPELAAELLERARLIAPDEPLYTERLEKVYQWARVPAESLAQYDVKDSPERAAFAARAPVFPLLPGPPSRPERFRQFGCEPIQRRSL